MANGNSDTGNTVIGQSILISGKLSGDEDLTVQGRVEGELSLSHTLIVEPSGIVKANVSVKNAIVSGVVVGNITATESVELTREGRMVGDINAPRVIIVDGASFRGHVDMGEAEPGRRSEERPVSRPVVRSAPSLPPRPAATAPARPTPPAAAPRTPARAAPPPPPPPPPPPAPKAKTKPLPPPPPARAGKAPAPVAVSNKKVLVKKRRR
ncbi:MAG TPA: polymer-forming cytoskeletal protein [Myxococcaceae bacterium]|nr:polymer-forming cytoskeletal protein [Myxococcaceae bacterium]